MDVTQRRISIIARGVGRFTTRTMRREGIGASEFDLIQAVRCHPGITQAEVCQRLEIDKGAAARQFARLEAKGDLRRETNPADRGIDWAGLERTIALAVRFLDNVVDASQFPLERIAEQVRRNRKIGLGVMGWADLLYQLRIPYDSAAAAKSRRACLRLPASGRPHRASRRTPWTVCYW